MISRGRAFFAAAILLAMSVGCPSPPDAAQTAKEVEGLLTAQAQDWTEGDLKGFCAVYADDAVFISPSGKTVGRAQIEERYRKKYIEGGAQMGSLSLDVEDLELSHDRSTAMVVMRWKLTWSADHDPPEASGLSLITLRREAKGWRILQDASM